MNTQKLVVGGVLLALVLSLIGVFKNNQVVVNNPTPVVGGAQSGPDSYSPYSSFNGVVYEYRSSRLNQATTTVCSLRAPLNATSTLEFASMTITTGTTTTLFWDIAKDSTYAASTTRLASASLTGGTVGTLVASTTVNSAGAGFDQANVFSPGQYLNFKYGGAQGATNVLVGGCKAVFVVGL